MPIQNYEPISVPTKAAVVDLALLQGAAWPSANVTYVLGGDPHVDVFDIATGTTFRIDIGDVILQTPSGLIQKMTQADFNAQYQLVP